LLKIKKCVILTDSLKTHKNKQKMEKNETADTGMMDDKMTGPETITIPIVIARAFAHDTRSPLASMINLLEETLGEFESLSSKDLKRRLGGVLTSAQRLLGTIEDLQTLAMIQPGQAIPLSETNLADETEMAVLMLQDGATKKGVEIKRSIPSIKVLANPVLLRAVVQNLISNAIKFSIPGESVIISAENLKKDGITISVTDYGQGMTTDKTSSLFQGKAVVSSNGTMLERGHGVGLLNCQKIIEIFHGKIWAESDGKGQGSKFSFSIPLAPPTPPAKTE